MSAADRYRDEVGDAALERQQAARAAGRCDYCWADPDQPHTSVCPHAPVDDLAGADTEAMF